MASFTLKKLGTSKAEVVAIRVREQSESSTENRYISGTIDTVINFRSKADGLSHTYIVEVEFKDCKIATSTFTLIEPCKATPALIITEDCNLVSGSQVTLKIKATLAGSTTVRVRILSGTTVLKNEVVNSGVEVSYLVPKATLKVIAEHPTLVGCKNEQTHVIDCDCAFTIDIANPRGNTSTPDPDPELPTEYPTTYLTPSTIATKQVNHWDRGLGYFVNTYAEGGSIIDYIGGYVDSPFVYNNPNHKLTNLGLLQSGIYLRGTFADQGVEYGDISQYLQREPDPNKRYLYLGQASYERTNPVMPEYLKDLNPSIVGAPFKIDGLPDWQPEVYDISTYRVWNIVAAWFNRTTPTVVNGDVWGIVRFNVEGHAGTGSYEYFARARNIWSGGKYRHARNGGTNTNYETGETKKSEEPDYTTMSDASWIELVRSCQAWYSTWLYGASYDQGVKTIGYDLESQAGFMQTLRSPGAAWDDSPGYRKDPNWVRKSPLDQRSMSDVMFASNNGWLDTIFEAAPYQLVYTDIDPATQHNGHYAMADFAMAELNAPTQIITNGGVESTRFTVNRNDSSCPTGSSVTIRFEDMEGNLRKTNRPMNVETATDDWRANGRTNSYTVPLGVTTFKYCHHVPLGDRWSKSIDWFADNKLMDAWNYANLNYVVQNGRSFQYQVYTKITNQRHWNATNEVTQSGQLPKSLVYGLRFLGYTFNIVHIWYVPTGIAGNMTMQNVFEAERRAHEHMDHFIKDQVKWVPVEVSMDGGTSWTSSEVVRKRNDIVAGTSDGFYDYNPNSYSPTWVINRRNNNLASPFIFVTYNSVTKSYVYFMKAAFGDYVNFSFRIKEGNGQYKYFNNIVADNKWKDVKVNTVI